MLVESYKLLNFFEIIETDEKSTIIVTSFVSAGPRLPRPEYTFITEKYVRGLNLSFIRTKPSMFASGIFLAGKNKLISYEY